MDTFSLEDDDAMGLFIIQEAHQSVDNNEENCDGDDGLFLGVDPLDFGAPSKSLVTHGDQPHYSDISDDDVVFDNGKDM